MGGLSPSERAELEWLRRQAAARPTATGNGGARVARWFAAAALLVVAAVLANLAVIAGYLRGEVLDTDTYVATVAPLAENPAVRDAVAQRLTDELVRRSDLTGLANSLADRLEAQGAPAQLSGLVGPLVNGISSFLTDRINQLMATERFETAWQNINRVAHEGVVSVLTGRQGGVLSSQGTTVNLDIGELLSLVKQQLVAEGLSIFGRIPDVSISYPLLESDQLPKIRTYVKALDAAATWLPWLALALLLAGIAVAPNRRRGIIVGSALVGALAVLALGVVSAAQSYYVDHLPAQVTSPQAAAAVMSTVLRFLVASLQVLALAMLIFLAGALLAGPSRPAVALRRLANLAINAGARLLARAGAWVARVARVLAAAYQPLRVLLVLAAVVGFVLAKRPSAGSLLWLTAGVLLVLLLVELVVRAGRSVPARG